MKGNIIGKAMAGLLFLLLVLGLLIFVSAWTADYPQGWVYLLTFGISTSLITLYLYRHDRELLKRRTKAGAAAEKETNQKIIQSVSGIAFCLVYIVSGLDYRFHWSGIPFFISILADVFVAAGFYIVFLVFRGQPHDAFLGGGAGVILGAALRFLLDHRDHFQTA